MERSSENVQSAITDNTDISSVAGQIGAVDEDQIKENVDNSQI